MTAKDKINFPHRTVTVDGLDYLVPRGVGRNNRNRSWQVKSSRKGELVLAANYADDSYGSVSLSLEAASKLVISSKSAGVQKSIKLVKNVTLTWTTVGKNILGISARVYNPVTKKGVNIYLISQPRFQAGLTDDLKGKMIRALRTGWDFESGGLPLSLNEMIKMDLKVDKFLESEDWLNFSEVGAELALSANKD